MVSEEREESQYRETSVHSPSASVEDTVQSVLNVSPVSHHPLQTGQFGALAPPGPGPVRLTPRHSEGWSTAALLHYPLYEAGVQTVGHRVDIALTLNVISPGQ